MNYTAGGAGRIAVYYENTFSGNFTPGYLQKQDTPDTLFNADFETANLSQWTSNVNDACDPSTCSGQAPCEDDPKAANQAGWFARTYAYGLTISFGGGL